MTTIPGGHPGELRVYADAEQLARAAAELFAELALEGNRTRTMHT